MTKMKRLWKKGRGRLGALRPLIGAWEADTDSPMGTVHCVRTFTPILGGAYVQLTARWKYSSGSYEELAVLGVGEDGKLRFWSFTSDGKRSEGALADVTDIHPEAIGFVAHMPAGLARMAYWPDGTGGFHWVVEAKTTRGWKRFTEHHYTAAGELTNEAE